MRDIVIIGGVTTPVGSFGGDPAFMGLGPIPGVRKVLKTTGLEDKRVWSN